MKLGGMQPYFFPYLGYFAVIKHTDKWIIADNVQFMGGSWIERNRILKSQAGWNYIRVPLEKSPYTIPINKKRIRTNENWQRKIFSQLVLYKKIAPYYHQVIDLLDHVFSSHTNSIVELNTRGIKAVCEYLGLPFTYILASRLDVDLKKIKEPDDWPLEICLLLGADEYINPPGGKSFYNKDKFERNQVRLKFLQVNLLPYQQNGHPFEPGLSILDVMMFNSIDKINEMLDEYEFL